MLKTPFYDCHVNSNAKLVEFCGYSLPINYGSQIKEHEAVRNDAGMFDVSHMQIIDLSGSNTKDLLRLMLSNDVSKLDKHGIGKALYCAMLNEEAGVIDDLIVYLLEDKYRIVANSGTREKDLAWITSKAKDFDVTVTVRKDLAILAVQGPKAISKVAMARPDITKQLTDLKQFSSFTAHGCFYARTGYTGENGLEIIIPNEQAITLWQDLLNVNIAPCGLGARDTLRLEAGMNLYGHDMDENINPLVCGMDWVVDLNDPKRVFVGKDKYLQIKKQAQHQVQIGVILEGKGVLREGQKIIIGDKESGTITSGTFSPTLKSSIAIARVNNNNVSTAKVDIRGNLEPIRFVKLPFVRNGKILIEE